MGFSHSLGIEEKERLRSSFTEFTAMKRRLSGLSASARLSVRSAHSRAKKSAILDVHPEQHDGAPQLSRSRLASKLRKLVATIADKRVRVEFCVLSRKVTWCLQPTCQQDTERILAAAAKLERAYLKVHAKNA